MKKFILFIVRLLTNSHLVSSIWVAKLKYVYKLHKWPNFKEPKDLNEVINHLKFYSDTSQWSRLADKYAVRGYVKEKGLDQILVRLYGKWNTANEIDWNSLPERYVLKCNNGSGDVVIIKSRPADDEKQKVIKYFNKIQSRPYGELTGEPHYGAMKFCIIAEEMLDISTQPCNSNSLVDYKIWVINGKAEYVWCCYNRTKTSTEVCTFDCNWNFYDEYSVYTHHYKKAHQLVPRPSCLEQMIVVAEKLAEGFPVLRVDLYEVNGKVYFGELTFSSSGGYMDFYTQEFLDKLGSMVKLQ